MKDAAILLRFLCHDPVGRRLGVGVLVVAWFALAWASLVVAAMIPILLVACEVIRRRRAEALAEVDELDDLF
jgi:hypothetical protein